MPRQINAKLDALFVEGPDDGAVINAFVQRMTGVDVAKLRLVRANVAGGGDSWALREFDKYVAERRSGDARVGVVVDRDGAEHDKWPALRERLRQLEVDVDGPSAAGAIVEGRFGMWMWPDNVSHGDLEDFVAGMVPQSTLLAYATEVSGIAKTQHGAEYETRHSRKASLKTRSVWRDASAAGGYGHLIRNLDLSDTLASARFLEWFTRLFLA